MKLFDENGRHVGELFEGGSFSLAEFGLSLLGLIILAALSFIVAYFSKWWGQTGYWLGLIVSFILYTVLFIFVWKREGDGEVGKGILIWLALSIAVIGAFDFVTTMVTGQDVYLILGGYGNS